MDCQAGFLTPTAYHYYTSEHQAHRVNLPANIPPDPGNLWTFEDGPYKDTAGKRIGVREGVASSFGYLHYASAHQVYGFTYIRDAVTETYRGNGYSYSGTTATYDGYVVHDGEYPGIHFIVSAAYNTSNQYGATPDGLPVGVITAYCQGYTTCHSWVGDA